MAQRLKRLLMAILSVVVLWQSTSYAQQLNASDGPQISRHRISAQSLLIIADVSTFEQDQTQIRLGSPV